jgi:hypothetical protein
MIKTIKYTALFILTTFFVACVPSPTPQRQPSITMDGIGGAVKLPQTIRTPVIDKVYGAKPLNYTRAIPAYFSSKIARGNQSQYKYGQPKRAYKRKGLAYGGDIAWRGWLVETLIATPSRTGRLLTPKPYMVLFSGEQIVEHILGNSHKLLIKVDR